MSPTVPANLVWRSLGWLVLALILAGFVLWWIGDGGVFAAGSAWIALPILAAVAAVWLSLVGLAPVPGQADQGQQIGRAHV